jgi:hypothetical protein
MKPLEYCLTCFSIAGILFVFTMWTPDTYPALLAPAHTDMHCPDLRFMHYVGGNLKTGLDVVDACAANLNVVKY